MMKFKFSGAVCALVVLFLGTSADAKSFNVPGGDLKTALDDYKAQSGV